MGLCFTSPKLQKIFIEINKLDEFESTTATNCRLATIRPFEFKRENSMSMRNLSNKPKMPNDTKLITRCLRAHFIFSVLTDEEILSLVNHMKYYSYNQGEIIFQQGNPGNNFYVIGSGQVQVEINGNKITCLQSGCSFGEIALLHSTPRTATVIALAKTSLWGLHRSLFSEIIMSITTSHYLEIQAFVDSIELLGSLTDSQKKKLANNLIVLKYNAGFKIIKEGDLSDSLYIIESGKVSCVEKGVEVKILTKGDYFGDKAIFDDTIYNISLIAIEPVKCLTINRIKLEKLLGNDLQMIIYGNLFRTVIQAHPILGNTGEVLINKITNAFKVYKYEAGDVVVKNSTYKNNALIVVFRGKVIGKDTGDCYGSALGNLDDYDGEYKEDIIANNNIVIGIVLLIDIETCARCKYKDLKDSIEIINIFRKLYIFKYSEQEKLIILSKLIKKVNFLDEEIIFEQNSRGSSLFIIIFGKVNVFKDDILVRTIGIHDYFGERAILNSSPRSATVKAKGNVVCWELKQEDFLKVTDPSMLEYCLKRIHLQDQEIFLSDLQIINFLGKGSFGNVFLVEHLTNQSLYALKCIDKRVIEAYEIEENILTERNILREIDHDFIMKLVKCFKDSQRVYFLVEYVAGMSLFDVSMKLGLISYESAKFYIGSLIIILNYLHERDILYRDLKPENIIIDSQGYPKMIDFGTSKITKERSYTVLGTPHYMAPEIILSKGYGHEVDYWALGIILYELLYGIVPFGHDVQDPYEIFQQILEKPLKFPKMRSDENAINLITNLLNPEPNLRVYEGLEELKKHDWFRGFNWKALENKEHSVPYMPELEEAMRYESDLSFFDRISQEEKQEEYRIRKNPIIEDWDKDI